MKRAMISLLTGLFILECTSQIFAADPPEYVCVYSYVLTDMVFDHVGEYIYDYNDSGQRTARYDLTDGNRGDLDCEYEYDENGNCILERSFLYDDVVSREIQHEYDAEGRLLTDTYRFPPDETVITIKYVYNGDKLTGTIPEGSKFTYDDKGLLIKEEVYDNDHILFETHEYQYDEHGNKIKSLSTMSGDFLQYEQFEYVTLDDYLSGNYTITPYIYKTDEPKPRTKDTPLKREDLGF